MENTNTPQEEIQYFKDKTNQILQENNFAKISTRIKLRRIGFITLAFMLLLYISWRLFSPIEAAIEITYFIIVLLLIINISEEINVAKKKILEKFKLNKQELEMFYKILHSFELLDKDCKAKIIYDEISEDGISFKNIEPIIKALNDKTEEINKEKIASIKEKQKISVVQNTLNGSNDLKRQEVKLTRGIFMENTSTAKEEIQYFKDKTKQVLQGDDLAKILTKIKIKGVGFATLAIMPLLFVPNPKHIPSILLLGWFLTILLIVLSMVEKINVAKKETLGKFKLNKQELAMFNKILYSFELLDKDCKAKIIYDEISEDGISFKNIEPIIKALNDKTEAVKKEKTKSAKEKQKISIVQNILNGTKCE